MIYGIIGAMDSEIALLTSEMTSVEQRKIGNLLFYSGVLCGADVVVVKCGVGKVNAAACTQMLIDRYEVDVVINVGVAGGVSADLKVLDVVVGTSLVQHDFDLRPFGYAKGYLGEAFGGDSSKPTRFEADAALAERCVKAAKQVLANEHTCYCGVIASGDEFVAASERRMSIAAECDAIAAEMEGAAIAQVARLNNRPFVVLRTISDLADGSAPVSFETVVSFAADTAASIIMQMLRS
ncbi:MAG: 5'-methylthioadenosine/adenosylhomocysteine nucleosidase [Clostridia bacterium]|nr:5'-methylthioadenosine/adenosylhomocysteine nucleosidase [Clostridia bacterium]